MNETLYPDIRIYLIWIMMKIKLIFLKVFKNIYHNLYIKASHVQLNESIINFFRIQFDLDFCNIEFHTWIQDFTHRAPRQKKEKYPLIFYNGKILPCCNHRFKRDHFLHNGSPWYPYFPFADGSWVLFKYLSILMPYISCDVNLAWGP